MPKETENIPARLDDMRRQGCIVAAQSLLDASTEDALSIERRALYTAQLALAARLPAADVYRNYKSQMAGAEHAAYDMVAAHIVEATVRYRLGQHANAIAAFNKAKSSLDTHPSDILHVDLLIEEATMYTWLGQFEKATTRYFHALSLAMDAGDDTGAALVWGGVGRLHLEQRDAKMAAFYFRKAIAVTKEWQDSREHMRLVKDLATAYLEACDYKDCIKMLSQFDALIEGNSEQIDAYMLFDVSGLRLLALYRQNDAQKLEAEQHRFQEHCDTKDDWQNALSNLIHGEIACAGNPEQSIEYLKPALEYFKAQALGVRQWQCLMLMMKAHMAIGDKQAAAQAATAAATLAINADYPDLLERTHTARSTNDLPLVPLAEKGRAIGSSFKDAASGYVVIGTLGQGGYGTVYHAYDTVRAQDVALKKFSFPASVHPEALQAVFDNAQKELISTSAVSHPTIVQVLSVGQDEKGMPYVVMPLVEGRSLRACMRDPEMAIETVMCRLAEVCLGLLAAHQAGIVHRDIKPENIMMTDGGGIKILDFGMAFLDTEKLDTAAATGTRPYMAPEHQKGEAATGAMDVFALGVLFYELIVGSWPWADAAPTGRLAYAKALNHAKHALRSKECSRDVEKTILAMLSYRPGKRPGLDEISETIQSAFAR